MHCNLPVTNQFGRAIEILYNIAGYDSSRTVWKLNSDKIKLLSFRIFDNSVRLGQQFQKNKDSMT